MSTLGGPCAASLALKIFLAHAVEWMHISFHKPGTVNSLRSSTRLSNIWFEKRGLLVARSGMAAEFVVGRPH